jgi:hypothetical protein
MRSLLLLLLTCLVIGVSAQLSVNPNPLSFSTVTGASDTKFELYITNSKDTTYTIYWQIEKSSTWPTQWGTYLCDLNLCYAEGVDKCPNSKPNFVPKGTHKYEFHLLPNGIAGSSTVMFKLYTEKNCQGLIFSTPMNLTTTSTATKDVNYTNIKIFPNPSTEYFSISHSNNVYRVVLYNLFGKEVKSFFHYNNAQHEIGDLKSGMYVVKMFDSKGKLIKSSKLNKVFEGA